jgi:hypothetical protein
VNAGQDDVGEADQRAQPHADRESEDEAPHAAAIAPAGARVARWQPSSTTARAGAPRSNPA